MLRSDKDLKELYEKATIAGGSLAGRRRTSGLTVDSLRAELGASPEVAIAANFDAFSLKFDEVQRQLRDVMEGASDRTIKTLSNRSHESIEDPVRCSCYILPP